MNLSLWPQLCFGSIFHSPVGFYRHFAVFNLTQSLEGPTRVKKYTLDISLSPGFTLDNIDICDTSLCVSEHKAIIVSYHWICSYQRNLQPFTYSWRLWLFCMWVGVRDTALKCFLSYLSSRTFSVVMGIASPSGGHVSPYNHLNVLKLVKRRSSINWQILVPLKTIITSNEYEWIASE